MAARALIAAAVLFAYLAATMGAARAASELRRRVAAVPRDRRRRGGGPVLARCLGREAHRLGCRFDRAGDGADLHAPAGLALPPSRARSRAADRRGRVSAWSVSPCSPASIPSGGWWAVAGTLAVVLSSLSYASGNVIGKRNVHDTPGPVLATGAMLAAGLYLLVPGLLQLPHRDPDRRSDRVTARAGAGRHGPGPARLLPRAAPVRLEPRQPRHVPDARLRARLRRRAARRADHRPPRSAAWR